MISVPPAVVERHVYVTDASDHAILRFPLRANVPAQRPDAIVTGMQEPRGIAIDRDGFVYVVDQAEKRLLVFNPSPGTHSKPIESVPISHPFGIDALVVDPLGFVYVAWTAVCTTEGFSCGYATVYTPLRRGLRPFTTLSFGGGAGGPRTAELTGLAVNTERFLAAAAGGATPVIYANAPQVKAQYSTFCGAVSTSGVAWGTDRTIYEADAGGIQPKTPSQVVVVPDYRRGKTSNCPSFYAITSATLPLREPRGVAMFDGLLYVTGGYDPRAGSATIFVFNPRVAGPQKPLGLVAGPQSMLRAPQSIAIGP